MPAGARFCPRCGVDANGWEPVPGFEQSASPHESSDRPREIVITLGRSKRLLGLLGYISLFLVIGSGVVWFLVRLGTPVWFAIVLVAFMIVVMVAMGTVVERHLFDKDQGF